MTTALAALNTEQEIDQALAWLTHLQQSHNAAPLDLPKVEAAVSTLSAPGDLTKTLARIAALLSPYYDKEIPQGVRQIDAEDWADALAPFPDWAIARACKWWKSDANKDRRKRPLEGDIVARVKAEMVAVRGMEIRLRAGLLGQATAATAHQPVTKERAAEIMAEAGFLPKTFGGDE